MALYELFSALTSIFFHPSPLYRFCTCIVGKGSWCRPNALFVLEGSSLRRKCWRKSRYKTQPLTMMPNFPARCSNCSCVTSMPRERRISVEQRVFRMETSAREERYVRYDCAAVCRSPRKEAVLMCPSLWWSVFVQFLWISLQQRCTALRILLSVLPSRLPVPGLPTEAGCLEVHWEPDWKKNREVIWGAS